MKKSTHTEARELSRPLNVDRIPQTGSVDLIVADAQEREAVALRLGIPAVTKLEARLTAQPARGGIKVSGLAEAVVEQQSVVSLDVFSAGMKFEVERFYLPKKRHADEGDEDADVIVGGEIDLGELLVESLALELDPYPRRPGEKFEAVEVEKASPEKPPSPFAALALVKPPKP